MLFEHVSDRGFRARYRSSDGFCPNHARNLESYRDGLAVAILGVDILGNIMPDLKKHKKRKPAGICPACEETARIEREFLGFIAEMQDPSFTEFFTASGGLCVPHFRTLFSQVRKVPAWLDEFQTKKFESLLERSRTFVECSAWGRQDDFAALPEGDKVVWKEIAAVLRGSRD